MGTLKKGILKMFFKNLGVVFYSTEMFSEKGFVQMELVLEKKEVVVLIKTLVVLCSRLEQLTHATTLPRYGTGLSPKSVFFSAGSLTLYKGL
jgi:hypothetical protein